MLKIQSFLCDVFCSQEQVLARKKDNKELIINNDVRKEMNICIICFLVNFYTLYDN